jgi:hypothetical protein
MVLIGQEEMVFAGGGVHSFHEKGATLCTPDPSLDEARVPDPLTVASQPILPACGRAAQESEEVFVEMIAEMHGLSDSMVTELAILAGSLVSITELVQENKVHGEVVIALELEEEDDASFQKGQQAGLVQDQQGETDLVGCMPPLPVEGPSTGMLLGSPHVSGPLPMGHHLTGEAQGGNSVGFDHNIVCTMEENDEEMEQAPHDTPRTVLRAAEHSLDLLFL